MRQVLHPDLAFDDLARQMVQAGWTQVPIPGLLLPLIPGEPEQACFERGDQAVIYSFNPALRLRVMDGDGPLPIAGDDLDVEFVKSRLQDRDPARQLWAMLAAAEMDLQVLQPDIARVAAELPEELRRPAEAALMRLTPPVAVPEADRGAGQGIGAFAVLPDTIKIQILRRTLRDDPAVAAQLVPYCWAGNAELAATAIVASARLRLVDQAKQIGRADLSDLSQTRHDREVFTALRKAALATLEGRVPQAGDAPRDRFWRTVLGQPDGLDPALILTALATPHPERAPDEPMVSLYHGGPLFQQIPPVAHWLGHGLHDGVPNPVRRWTPREPYLICEYALREVDTGGTGTGVVMTANPEDLLADLSNLFGRRLVLPKVEAWEAAMRGADGRAHPWGTLPRAPSGMTNSPWGMKPSGVAEWARRGDQLVLCGTDLKGHVGYIRVPQPGASAAVRPVTLVE